MRAKEGSPACRAALIVALVFASDRLEAQRNNPLIRFSAGCSRHIGKRRDLYQMRADKGSVERGGVKGK